MTFLFCHTPKAQAQASARANGAYYNTEKYWFYRYRLINDFMKIGSNCGESLPFGERTLRNNNDGAENTFSTGGEVPIHLGNYLATLSTEFRLLFNNRLSTSRTMEELNLAINAFERMDKNAESYTRDFYLSPLPETLSCNRQPQEGDFNGYFIRDDMPYQTFLYDNAVHFNRPGSLIMINPANGIQSAALKRLERIKPTSTDPWLSSWHDCVPHE